MSVVMFKWVSGDNSCWGKRFVTRTSYLLEVQVETYKVQSRT